MANTPLSPSSALGVYNETLPTYLDGNPTEMQTDERGRLIVVGGGSGAANAESIPVAASQTNSALQFGGAGAAGDYLAVLMIIPSTTSPGAVTYKDGSGGSSITAFAGGANSVNTLHPFPFVVNGRAATGPWYVTTGAGVTVVASGEPA